MEVIESRDIRSMSLRNHPTLEIVLLTIETEGGGYITVPFHSERQMRDYFRLALEEYDRVKVTAGGNGRKA